MSLVCNGLGSVARWNSCTLAGPSTHFLGGIYLYCTDLAEHRLTAGENLDDLDRDMSEW